jgi:DNA-binding response OmpR family regulator
MTSGVRESTRPDPGEYPLADPAARTAGRPPAEGAPALSDVLVASDDEHLAHSLGRMLRRRGHRILWCRFGADALTNHQDTGLVLLDLVLPDSDGLDILRKLRRVTTVPVIVVGERDDERSVVRALNCGADDYLAKPLRMRELLARIGAHLRRARADVAPDPGGTVVVEDVAIDLGRREVRVLGRPVRLTNKEFDVLAVLARNAGAAVSREQIMDQVWGDAFLALSRSLDVHLVGLRAKLGRPDLVRNIRGFGYQIG